YPPLDASKSEIRLLRLHPASLYDGDIYCELFHTSLESDPLLLYETVSYTWGKFDVMKPSHVYLHSQFIKVTSNLEDCLRCLRLVDKDRVIWVDALCIDQQSLSDRSSQVGLMHLIYRRTSGGLFWLG
ncbi:HET-domain-containing protein, partial [Cadophora sp. DSE1049]